MFSCSQPTVPGYQHSSCTSTIGIFRVWPMDVENYAIYAVDCVVLGKRLQSETRTRTKKTETGQSFTNKRTTRDY